MADAAVFELTAQGDALERPSSQIVNTELGCLRRALAGDELPLKLSMLESIWQSWTNLEACTLRLSALLSASFPLPQGMRVAAGEPANLLGECLSVAIAGYQRARTSDRDETGPPRAYLQGLLSAADGLCAYDVFGKSGTRAARWEIGSVPLVSFARGWDTIVFAPVSEPGRLRMAAKAVLVGALLRLEDAALLDRHWERSLPPLGAPRPSRKLVRLFPADGA